MQNDKIQKIIIQSENGFEENDIKKCDSGIIKNSNFILYFVFYDYYYLDNIENYIEKEFPNEKSVDVMY
jgi:hypothetical protein